jgi:hypothetical protein
MNKLRGDNEPVSTGAADDHPVRRICRLNDGDYCDVLGGEEDDIDQKSLTLETLQEKSKSTRESIRDRDFVSESSLTIISDSDLFQENSRWWSMINASDSNSNVGNPNHNSSMNALNSCLSSSLNDANNQTINHSNTPTTNTSNNNSNSISNHFYNTRSPTRRRSSLLSDITFESDEHDDDANTTESNDSSFNNSAALLATARRFAPNYHSGANNGNNNNNNNETIEEEFYDYQQQLNDGRSISKMPSGTTAAPVIPRRRVSVSHSGPSFVATSTNRNVRAAPTATATDDTKAAMMTHLNHAVTLRSIARGNAAAPAVPKRTSSHSSKIPAVQKNALIYQMYNASFSSTIVDSQMSHETEPSFFEDGSAAAQAAAAYLSSAAIASQQEEVRTVQSVISSHTTDTPVFKNQGNRRTISPSTDAETPPILPARCGSVAAVPPSFGILSSFEDDEDDSPSVVHKEEPQDSDSASNPIDSKTCRQAPSLPMRKRSSSDRHQTGLERSYSKPTQHPQSQLNTQPPTCPMRKESDHHAGRLPSASAIPSPRLCRSPKPSFSPRHQKQQQGRPSHKHKPPAKPMRTNSSTNGRSPAPTASS